MTFWCSKHGLLDLKTWPFEGHLTTFWKWAEHILMNKAWPSALKSHVGGFMFALRLKFTFICLYFKFIIIHILESGGKSNEGFVIMQVNCCFFCNKSYQGDPTGTFFQRSDPSGTFLWPNWHFKVTHPAPSILTYMLIIIDFIIIINKNISCSYLIIFLEIGGNENGKGQGESFFVLFSYEPSKWCHAEENAFVCYEIGNI